MRISALILARNEEATIDGCLRQLDFVDEIIVLDQSSSDKTVKIAQKYTDKVITTTTHDFDKNRNILLREAKGEWLLYVDSDERIDKSLKEEILNSIQSKTDSAYYFPRKNFVLGKWLRHGGWWPDYVPKLFKKSDLVEWFGKVHESPKVNGKMSYLKHPLEHHTARSISQMLQKSIIWAKVEAELAASAGHPPVTKLKVLKAMLTEFLSRYILKIGFLDGRRGLIQGIYQALHKAIVLTYLWEIQNKSYEKLNSFKNE